MPPTLTGVNGDGMYICEKNETKKKPNTKKAKKNFQNKSQAEKITRQSKIRIKYKKKSQHLMAKVIYHFLYLWKVDSGFFS
jgi:hypothetical protein